MSVYGANAPIKKQMDLEATIHYMLKADWERTPVKLFISRQTVYFDLPLEEHFFPGLVQSAFFYFLPQYQKFARGI